MAVKGEIKRPAVASLMLISLLDDEEKSPEESAIIQCFFFFPAIFGACVDLQITFFFHTLGLLPGARVQLNVNINLFSEIAENRDHGNFSTF